MTVTVTSNPDSVTLLMDAAVKTGAVLSIFTTFVVVVVCPTLSVATNVMVVCPSLAIVMTSPVVAVVSAFVVAPLNWYFTFERPLSASEAVRVAATLVAFVQDVLTLMPAVGTTLSIEAVFVSVTPVHPTLSVVRALMTCFPFVLIVTTPV